MYGTLGAAAGWALTDGGGCGHGIRWCMVHADEVTGSSSEVLLLLLLLLLLFGFRLSD